MRFHRFFIDAKNDISGALKEGEKINLLNKEIFHQMKNVLRFGYGDIAIFLDNSGYEYLVEIEGSSGEMFEMKVLEKRKNGNEPRLKIRLFQAMIKKDNMELVVQKGVEVGIFEFVPFVAARSEKTGLNAQRVEKIVKEASEQSGRGILPAVQCPVSFEDALKMSQKEFSIFLEKDGEALSYHLEKIRDKTEINIFVGPEGGWTPEEINAAEQAGFLIASLGLLTLRSETVGTVAAGVLFSAI